MYSTVLVPGTYGTSTGTYEYHEYYSDFGFCWDGTADGTVPICMRFPVQNKRLRPSRKNLYLQVRVLILRIYLPLVDCLSPIYLMLSRPRLPLKSVRPVRRPVPSRNQNHYTGHCTGTRYSRASRLTAYWRYGVRVQKKYSTRTYSVPLRDFQIYLFSIDRLSEGTGWHSGWPM